MVTTSSTKNEPTTKKSSGKPKKLTKPAFGSTVARFGKNTMHPNLDDTGLYVIHPKGCDPCLYHPKTLDEIFKVNKIPALTKDPWRYKAELEAWSKNLGYRNQHVLAERMWQRSLLGPAWTEVPGKLPVCEPACNNLSFGRTPRFQPDRKNLPGPGTYYKHVPFKGQYGPHSTRPTFEREEPCRMKDMIPRWSLAPNRYRILDKDSIENRPKKLVSRRGPYELFTGPRDGTTIKNHFNMTRCSTKTWPIMLPGCFEELKKWPVGRMNKTGYDAPSRSRMTLVDLSICIRKPADPGPASYLVEPVHPVFKQNKYGFNNSYDKPVGYQRVVVWPGVGRYRQHRVTCGPPGHGHRHVFRSKIERTIGANIPEKMNTF